jgi:hypothetical protein
MLTAIEAGLVKAGYVKSPNNIYNLPDAGWYASGPGLPSVAQYNDEIRCADKRLSVVRTTHSGEPYTSNYQNHHQTLAEFSSVAELVEWLTVNGKLSEPDLPAFSNSWD